MAEAVKERVMNVSREDLIKVITDYKSYPEFLDEVVGVEIAKGATPEKARVKFELEVVKRFDYVLDFNRQGDDVISWKLVESNFFKTNEGKWTLKDAGGGKTHATYALEVSFGFLVPGWITKKLTETSLPKLLENFENRAKKVAGGK